MIFWEAADEKRARLNLILRQNQDNHDVKGALIDWLGIKKLVRHPSSRFTVISVRSQTTLLIWYVWPLHNPSQLPQNTMRISKIFLKEVRPYLSYIFSKNLPKNISVCSTTHSLLTILRWWNPCHLQPSYKITFSSYRSLMFTSY